VSIRECYPNDAALTRRAWFQASVPGGALLRFSLSQLGLATPAPPRASDCFLTGRLLGNIPFIDEGDTPLEKPLGAELDGRLFTNLETLTRNQHVTPAHAFFVRTRASALIDTSRPWRLKLSGPKQEKILAVDKLARESVPVGTYILECAGNPRVAHFGMMSVARWTGVVLARILDRIRTASHSRVMISGFDTYASRSVTSIPGASWIFSIEELHTSRAFLATGMNGNRLTLDYVSPLRLIVPGWYGCCCIKWVNEIIVVDDSAKATRQMQEYAGRTNQDGVPRLAIDYAPATVDTAAMHIRIEKWLVKDRILYRVIGIVWGGQRAPHRLDIQFNADEPYVTLRGFDKPVQDSWRLWELPWAPSHPGRYVIRLRASGPNIRTRRMDGGYYVRIVQINQASA